MPSKTKTTKKKPANKTPKFDWTKSFKSKPVRRSIAKMVNEVLNLDDSFLDENASLENFTTTLVALSPACEQFLPKEITIDRSKIKSIALLHQLAVESKKKERNFWSPQADKNFINSAIALMSKGVTELDFTYSGGTDEISTFDDVLCEFHGKSYKSYDKQLTDSKEVLKWLDSLPGESFINAFDMMYSFLDDSGAGPPEYSQSFRIALFKWKCEKYGYEEDEYEEDEEDI
jgi:hypothetical protein